MANALSESEFQDKIVQIYKEEQLKVIQEKWDKLSGKDKKLVLEMLKSIYPEKAMLISEAKWYNTVGDIVGIFDPTGVVDLINGISYWKQGDKLFAVLSWISVLPYIGDAIAKPVVGVMKIGGESVKAFRYAASGNNAIKLAETAKAAGGPISKFVEKSPSWGKKLVEVLRSSVGKFPFLNKIIGLVEEYLKLFTTASKEMKVGSEITKGLATAEKETLKNTFKGFREYAGGNNYFKYIFKSDVPLWHKFTAGAPRLFGNAATRSLMRRTKWYLGLLDSLGIADTKTTPDELLKKYPDIDSKINDYNETEQAQKKWTEDFGSKDESINLFPEKPQQQLIPQTAQPPKPDIDPFSLLFNGLFA